jgi:hypothetical protein
VEVDDRHDVEDVRLDDASERNDHREVDVGSEEIVDVVADRDAEVRGGCLQRTGGRLAPAATPHAAVKEPGTTVAV